MIIDFLSALGRYAISLIMKVGDITMFTLKTVGYSLVFPWYGKQFFKHLINIGFFSIPIVGMTAIFTGAVLVLQSYVGFSRFSAESSIPTVVVLSMTRELGPVLSGLMITGRVGSSMAAEIATMKVTEQIDALLTLAVNPMKYLVVPRVIASIIILPLLVIIADIIGIMGGYLVATSTLGFNKGVYLQNTVEYLKREDVISGLIKAAIFGFIVALSGCYHGYTASKGAAGVGRATINAVVMAAVLILFFNYITTQILFT
jgi:phospholipid/cholesterol/gamma-HCH transport system permease protein